MSTSETSELDGAIVACLEGLGSDAQTLTDPHGSLRRRLETSGGGGGGGGGGKAAAVIGGPARDKTLLETVGSSVLLIEGTLGEGGMGVVHIATQASLGRKVAVKRLRPDKATPEATLRLLREAWITGSLEHPNILPIHDVRMDEQGRPQIVLKHIEGISWDDAIHDAELVRTRLGAETDLLDHNLGVLMQVCRAVHFAHSRGIVHRDLKPSNVMIGAHGEVYLLDWGIALYLHAAEDHYHHHDDDDATSGTSENNDDGRGEVAGTPGYMAPELLLGTAVSKRTDVYLLGAILYEILAGKPPHRGDTPDQVARSVLRSTPEAPDGAPQELVEIMRRAMKRRPDDRYPSAEELRIALATFLRRRTAVRLTEEAERRLGSLRALVDETERSGTIARRADAYQLYGGSRFGFREALAIWPDCEAAQRGLERAVAIMIELELACGEAQTASELLAELEHPPSDLSLRVTEMLDAWTEERRRLDSLEALGEDRDAQRGARTRRFLVAALGLSWTIAPLVSAISVDPKTGHYPPMYLAPLAVIVCLVGITYWGRNELRKTAINRGVVATIAIGVVAQLAVALASPVMGQSEVHARIMMLLVWTIVVAMASVTLDRRLWWGALGAFASFAVAVAAATGVAHVQYAMAASYFIISINALVIWRGTNTLTSTSTSTSISPLPSSLHRWSTRPPIASRRPQAPPETIERATDVEPPQTPK